MVKLRITYFNLIFAFVLSLSSCKTHAQNKSTDVRTINGKKYYIHKVEKGQSLYAIAKVYNMDVNSILAENDEAIDGIKQGQELKIPVESLLAKPTTSIDTNKYVYYKVQKGETIYAITKKYAIDEKKLQTYNPTLSNGLKEGDLIIVGEKKKPTVGITPSKTDPSTEPSVYIVQQGETLYGLSKKFNVTTDDLLRWNPDLKDGIKQGQVLKFFPGNGSSVSSTTPSVALTNNTSTTTTAKDTLIFNKPKKSTYEIGLFLPFKLAETDLINVDELARAKASFPATQALAIDFYEGFKKAVDSLSAKDFEVNINLYDMEDRDSLKIETICKSNDFKKLDAIFGPLYLSGFKIVSNYARASNIPIVSPVIQQNKILYNNPISSKVTPSLYTMIESLADYCSDSLMSSSNIIIVNTTSKDLQYIKTFKKRYNDNLFKYGKTLKDSIKEVKGLAEIKNAYVGGKKNVVVMLTNNPIYLQDILTQLYIFAEKKEIVLMGFEGVSNIDNLDQEYLNRLQFHFPSSNHIDYNEPGIRHLTKNYQELNFSDPSDYYFEGFDIGLYYLSNLKLQGASFFLNLDKYNWDGFSTGFKFYRPDIETGFENRATTIYKYSNYKLHKIGWK